MANEWYRYENKRGIQHKYFVFTSHDHADNGDVRYAIGIKGCEGVPPLILTDWYRAKVEARQDLNRNQWKYEERLYVGRRSR